MSSPEAATRRGFEVGAGGYEPMSLTPDQKQFYQNTLSVTKKEISELEDLIQQELAKVKDRLNELQNAQKAARQMYDAACQRLGIANELEEAESRQG
jgi:butyrate kinase